MLQANERPINRQCYKPTNVRLTDNGITYAHEN